MEVDWKALAEALIEEVEQADYLTREQKGEVMIGALKRSPKYLTTGDVAFEELLIRQALEDPEWPR